MRAGTNDHVKIAGGPALYAGVALARNSDPLAVASARFDANLQGFGALDGALPVAVRADRTVFAGSPAAGAGKVELHPSPDLGDLPGAVALGTLSRGLNVAPPVTVDAGFAASYIEPHNPTADGCP